VIPASLILNPTYLAPSAWWQHVPIAHWLVEEIKPETIVELGTHYGVSFFSFCEAAATFSPDTFVYAIDTWEGDPHASFYTDEVFSKVESHWKNKHMRQSSLIRSTFDDAVNYFKNTSVDILHIDGLHTYEAVKHDFNTWLPKMKNNSLILFHDINVRERGFGVWQLWQELKQTHKTLEVLNGHGLGLVILGDSMESRLANFGELARVFQAKGELLEKIAQMTLDAGGDVGNHDIEQVKAEALRNRTDLEKIRQSRIWRATYPARASLDNLKKYFKLFY
jgi:hypothetical protein